MDCFWRDNGVLVLCWLQVLVVFYPYLAIFRLPFWLLSRSRLYNHFSAGKVRVLKFQMDIQKGYIKTAYVGNGLRRNWHWLVDVATRLDKEME